MGSSEFPLRPYGLVRIASARGRHVEPTKKWIGVRQSTGDSFVLSVLWGTAIGRVGCFLTGLSDRTYGIATTLSWGIDFGDGVARHPTQLYEIGFLIALFFALRWCDRLPCRQLDLELVPSDKSAARA